MEKPEKELLEWLLQAVGGGYLSDLRWGVRSPSMSARVRRALQTVHADDWTTGQWADAFVYLTDQRGKYPSQVEYVRRLLSCLDE